VTGYEWLRAYTALARTGVITDEIRACEEAWGNAWFGDPSAIERIRLVPSYDAYARALRSLLKFPLTVYRVTSLKSYEEWRAGTFRRPVSTTLSLDLACLYMEMFPEPEPQVLIEGRVSRPDAIIMRGRIEGYELVVDSACVEPVEVRVLG
jgi:hypothetical protein